MTHDKAAPNSSAAVSGGAPPHPLERLTTGGWLRGLARLAVGVAVVTAVILWTGDEVWSLVFKPSVLPLIGGGAVIHVMLRCARIVKWARMIRGTELTQHGWRYLLRVQFIGMLANQAVPVSEALKIWAVARDRRTVVTATESLAADMALHSLMIGAAGLAAVAALGARAHDAVWAAAVVMIAAPLSVLVALRWWPRPRRPRFSLRSPAVLLPCALETLCQLAVYAVAMRAIEAPMPLVQILAFAPLLFVSDLFMLTPSGLGLREALFAVVFAGLASSPPEAGVAVGIVISAMLFVTSAVGGAVALLLPRSRAAGDGT